MLKAMKKKELPQVEPVVLKDFAGHRAGFWILLSLIGIILLIIFLLLFLPGIVNGGKYVIFSSPLSDTAVYVDGKYLGSTENKYFVKHGEHEAVFIKSNEELSRVKFHISNPVFATLFIRYNDEVKVKDPNYTSSMIETNREQYAKDLARYSAVTTYNEFYFYNPIITKYFSDSISYGSKTIESDYLYTLSHITSKEMLEDFNAATELLNQNGYNLSSKLDLDSILSESGTTLTSSSNIDNPPYIKGNVYTYPTSTLCMGKTTTSNYPNCNTAPITLTVNEFSMMQEMVSEKEYAEFVKANPEWAQDKVTADMADENYLKGINLSSPSSLPIRNISYKAAKAYAEYLSQKEGKRYRLPTEAEWTVMANSVQDVPYASSMYTLSVNKNYPSTVMGGLWEFTQSYYLPLSRLLDYTLLQELARDLDKDDIIIKGGSYINKSSEIDKDDVGIITQTQTSPYVGLRLCVEM